MWGAPRQRFLSGSLRSAVLRDLSQRGEQQLPPLRVPELEDGQGEAVAGRVAARDGVPAAVFHGDARLVTDGLEADGHFGLLLGREALLAPFEGELRRRLPDFDLAHFEDTAALQGNGQASADTRLEG